MAGYDQLRSSLGLQNLSDQDIDEVLNKPAPGIQEVPVEPEQNTSFAGDTADLLQRGASLGIGGVLDFVGADDTAQEFYDIADQQLETLTPETREAMNAELVSEEGDYYLGKDAGNIRAWTAKGIETLGMMAVPIPGGAGVSAMARVGLGMTKAAKALAQSQKVIKAAEKQGITPIALAKRQVANDNKFKEWAATTIGYGGAEGATAAGLTEREVRERVLATDQEQLGKSPVYQKALEETGGDKEAARLRVADKLSKTAALKTFGPTALLGAGAGRIYDRMLNGLGSGSRALNIVRGGITEAAEEMPQSAIETISQNQAMQQIDPSIDIMDEVGPNIVAGGILGGATGGIIGGAMPKGGTVEETTKDNIPEVQTGEATVQSKKVGVGEAQKEDATDVGLEPRVEDVPVSPAKEGEQKAVEIEEAAKEAATSPDNDLPEPTQAQKEAGNYKVGKVRLHGMDVSIENPKGSTRSGTDEGGKKWSQEMKHHYGYFKRSEARDGDNVDVFLGDNAENPDLPVFVIDQVDPKTKKYDEPKVVMGAATKEEAADIYHSNYEKGWQGIGGIRKMSLDEFKGWVANKKRTKKRAALMKYTGYDKLDKKVKPSKKTAQEDEVPSIPESKDATGKQASWVVKEKETGDVVVELFDKEKVEAVNKDKYDVVPVAEHLSSLNKKAEPKKTVIKNKAKKQPVKKVAQKTGADKPKKTGVPILDATKKRYVSALLKKNKIRKESPGYPAAVKKAEASYETEVEKAYAALPFDKYNELNPDSTEEMNRQVHTQLKEEYKIEPPAATETVEEPKQPEEQDSKKEAKAKPSKKVVPRGTKKPVEQKKEADKGMAMFAAAAPTESQEFKEWAGTDEIIEPDEINSESFGGSGPFIMRVFHGTTHEFEQFDASVKGTKEGQFGAVNYFTSSEYDAEQNYAGEGEDLTNRIEQLAERIEADEEIDMDEARERAKKELHGGDAGTLELFVRTEKPFVIGGDSSPWIEFVDYEALEKQAVLRVAEEYDLEPSDIEGNREEYEDEIIEAQWNIELEEPNPLVEAIESVASEYDVDTAQLFAEVSDYLYEGMRHSKLEEILRESESLMYAEDNETGELAGFHMLGEIIQELGFDSIILKDAETRFSNMDMVSNTAHVHVFDSYNTNIKSVENRGTFDPKDQRILFATTKGKARGLSTNRVQKIIAPVVDKWTTGNIQVVDTFDNLPQNIKDQAGNLKVKGVYDRATGKTYLVADMLNSSRDVLSILAHEVVGHHSMEEMLGAQYGDILEEVQRLKGKSQEVGKIASEVRRRYGNLDKDTESAEIIAVMAEKGINNSLMRRIYTAVKKFLRSLGFKPTFNVSELREMLSQAESRLRVKPESAAPEVDAVPAYATQHPTFYSELTKQVELMKQPKAPAAQWKAMIRKAKGVKQEEIDWSGVEQWLDEQKGTITKEDLVDYLRSQEVQIQEVTKGNELTHDRLGWMKRGNIYKPSSEFDLGYIEFLPTNGRYIYNRPGGTRDPFKTLDAAKNDVLRVAKNHGIDNTKFSDFQMEGDSEGYRELLLTLPSKPAAPEVNAKNFYQHFIRRGGEPSWESLDESQKLDVQNQMPQEALNATADKQYRSSHWDEPSVLAHVRFNERDIEGKRTLFVEEIQSDWAQEGKKKGYAYKAEIIDGDWGVMLSDGTFRKHNGKSEAEKAASKLNEYGGNVPNQPFKKTDTWAMLPFKRMIRYAAENGFDQISWTPGQTQVERYDLSKHLDSVTAYKAGAGVHEGKYIIEAKDKTGKKVIDQPYESQELPNVIGKELADKIISDLGDKPSHTASGLRNQETYSGVDLRVGGEGMKGFYDKILPKAVQKYVKKFGAKVSLDTVTISGEADIMSGEEAGEAEISIWSIPVTDKMRESAMEGQPMFAAEDPDAATFETPEEQTYWDKMATNLIDRFHSLTKVQKAIGDVDEAEDVSLAVTLFPGKARARIDEFTDDTVVPLAEMVEASSHSFEDVGKYLHARHAKEANAVLRKRNPSSEDIKTRKAENEIKVENIKNQRSNVAEDKKAFRKNHPKDYLSKKEYKLLDKKHQKLNKELERLNRITYDTSKLREDNKALSGMSDTEAAEILKQYESDETMKEIADRVNQINKDHVDMLVAEELITKEEAKAWMDNYSNYVPLHRSEVNDTMPKRGRGFDIRGKESKFRGGSTKAVDHKNMIARIVAQSESAMVRAEKNKVSQTMYRLAEANPNSKAWSIDEMPQVAVRGKDGTVSYRPNVNDPNVFAAKFDGEQKYMYFNPSNPHSQQIVKALKNLDKNDQGPIVNALLRTNRLLAMVNTSLSPEFVISNFFRDIQTAGYNLTDTEVKNLEMKIIKDVPKAIKGLHSALRGKKDHEYAKHFETFRRAGGMTGWMQSYDSIEGRMKSIQNELKGNTTPGLKQLRKLMKVIEDYNTIVENGVRLSTFVNAKESGLSDAKAAKIAKQVTVDFNRRGEWGTVANALYLFYNASVQGTARLLRATLNPKNKRLHKMLFATVAAAATLDMLNRAFGGDDDDGESLYDKIPDHIKDRNLIIMDFFGLSDSKDGVFFKMPLPWGFNTFHVLGQEIGGGIHSTMGDNPEWDAGDASMRLMGATLEAFNPTQDGSILQTLSPTVIDPFVRIAENKDWHGGPLYPNYDKAAANFRKYYGSARDESVAVAQWMHEATLNPRTLKSWADISPEWIDMFYDFVTGSAGRVIADTAGMGTKLATGEDFELREVPMLRKLAGEVSEGYRRSQFYDAYYEILDMDKELRKRKGDSDYLEIKKRVGTRLKLVGTAKATRKQLRKLKKIKNLAKGRGNTAKADKVQERMDMIMSRFMKRYRRVIYGETSQEANR